jgi:malate synthase
MEDAATAEISRAQVWQWLHHGVRLSDGRTVSKELVRSVISEQRDRLRGARATEAANIFDSMITSSEFPEFLTLVAYDSID